MDEDGFGLSTVKRYLFWCMVLFFSLITGYEVVFSWRGIALSQKADTTESLLRAANLDPSNPDSFYKLGVLYEWDLIDVDLSKSVQYLWRAIERNPLEQNHWLALARVLQKAGEDVASERSIEKAIAVFPTSYRGRWVVGNLLLQRGELEKALPHFSYILSHYSNESTLTYDVWRKTVNDPDFILERLIPEDRSSMDRYLAYLYDVRDMDSARKIWEKLASLGHEIDRHEMLRHVDFLISCGEITEAAQIWMTRLHEQGIPAPAGGNLTTNSGFEKEKVLGRGFDWRIGTVSGAEILLDNTVAYEGNRSLKITFSGKENLDFHHVYQFVAWKPGTYFVLTARVKTEALTTTSGIRMEVLGSDPAFHEISKSLSGDNDWTKLSVFFRTPSHSEGGMVRIRRKSTEKFDRFISGTVWVDEIQIREVAP